MLEGHSCSDHCESKANCFCRVPICSTRRLSCEAGTAEVPCVGEVRVVVCRPPSRGTAPPPRSSEGAESIDKAGGQNDILTASDPPDVPGSSLAICSRKCTVASCVVGLAGQLLEEEAGSGMAEWPPPKRIDHGQQGQGCRLREGQCNMYLHCDLHR